MKLKKITTEGSSLITTEYAGNYIYENGVLLFFNHAEGHAEPVSTGSTAFKYVYQYKDHLGNIRLSYKDVSTTSTPILQILEENNYYPFGLQHKGYNNVVNGTEHNWDYQGKENQKELGLNWHDFGARNYDAALGRWMNLDRLAEEYFDNSPFNFVANTPLIAYDPDGKRIRIVGSDDYKRTVFGQLINLALASDAGAAQVTQAINSDDTFTIFDPEYSVDHLDTKEGGGNEKVLVLTFQERMMIYQRVKAGMENL